MTRSAAATAIVLLAGCGGEPAPPVGPLPAGAPIVTPPADGRARRFDLGLPDRGWALRFEWTTGVDVTDDVITGGGEERTLMGLSGRAVLNVRLARAAPEGIDAVGARDRAAVELPALARSPVEALARWETGAVACLQFRLPNFRGSPLDRLERHCFAARDGWLAQGTVLWDHPPADAIATLDAWTASFALVERPVPPAGEALAFGRALLGGGDPEQAARAVRHLDVAAAARAELSIADRVRLGTACTDAWLALDRVADARQLLDALLAEEADPRLHFCRARVAAADGRLDDWEASLRAALAAPPNPDAPLPDPREEPAFFAVPQDRFDAVMREIERAR